MEQFLYILTIISAFALGWLWWGKTRRRYIVVAGGLTVMFSILYLIV